MAVEIGPLKRCSSLFREDPATGGGGFGSRGCSVKDAVASEEGLMKTKRKAAAGTFEEKKKPAPVPAVAAAGTGGEGENLTRLSQDLVDYILAWKPMPTRDPDEYYARMTNDPLQCFPQDHIDRTTARLRDLAEMTKRSAARFQKFQDWARAEYEAKGCVEVDDIYIAQRVLLRQAMAKETWDAEALEGLLAEGDGEDGAMENKSKEGISSN